MLVMGRRCGGKQAFEMIFFVRLANLCLRFLHLARRLIFLVAKRMFLESVATVAVQRYALRILASRRGMHYHHVLRE